MTTIKTYRLAFIPLLVAVTLLTACPSPVNKGKVVESFVQAINDNDVDSIVKLSANTLWVRTQIWEKGPDDKTLLLGRATDNRLADSNQIKSYFSEHIKNFSVSIVKSTAAPDSLFKDELKGIERLWQNLDMYLLPGSKEDAAHILVIGINDKGKVSAIYYN